MKDFFIETSFQLSSEMAQIIAGGLQDLLSLNVQAIAMDSHTWAIRVHAPHLSNPNRSSAIGYLKGIRLMLTELA